MNRNDLIMMGFSGEDADDLLAAASESAAAGFDGESALQAMVGLMNALADIGITDLADAFLLSDEQPIDNQ